MRNPGLQFQNRKKEIDEMINGFVIGSRNEAVDIIKHELEIQRLKARKREKDLTLIELLLLRDWLESAPLNIQMNQFGLPHPMDEEEWKILLHEIQERKDPSGSFIY